MNFPKMIPCKLDAIPPTDASPIPWSGEVARVIDENGTEVGRVSIEQFARHLEVTLRAIHTQSMSLTPGCGDLFLAIQSMGRDMGLDMGLDIQGVVGEEASNADLDNGARICYNDPCR